MSKKIQKIVSRYKNNIFYIIIFFKDETEKKDNNTKEEFLNNIEIANKGTIKNNDIINSINTVSSNNENKLERDIIKKNNTESLGDKEFELTLINVIKQVLEDNEEVNNNFIIIFNI